MPNIASLLKIEIARVARRAVRAETEGLKRALSAQRAEIAALKRRAQELQSELRQLRKIGAKSSASTPPSFAADETRLRFSAKRLAAQRKRLGLSAHEFGLLVGTSSQSIYNWESGAARPRHASLLAIARLRSMGKREVGARLAALQVTQP